MSVQGNIQVRSSSILWSRSFFGEGYRPALGQPKATSDTSLVGVSETDSKASSRQLYLPYLLKKFL